MELPDPCPSRGRAPLGGPAAARRGGGNASRRRRNASSGSRRTASPDLCRRTRRRQGCPRSISRLSPCCRAPLARATAPPGQPAQAIPTPGWRERRRERDSPRHDSPDSRSPRIPLPHFRFRFSHFALFRFAAQNWVRFHPASPASGLIWLALADTVGPRCGDVIHQAFVSSRFHIAEQFLKRLAHRPKGKAGREDLGDLPVVGRVDTLLSPETICKIRKLISRNASKSPGFPPALPAKPNESPT
jgi:hypothetical protein